MNELLKCIIVDDEPVAREILLNYVQKVSYLECIGHFGNALAALEFSKRSEASIFFLDINMPEINGLGLAKLLPVNATIIFTTAYREYAVDGFDLQATDYLLKPISFPRFLQAVERCRENSNVLAVKGPKEREYIFVKSDKEMVKVLFEDILYLESYGDYIKIHTKDKMILIRETIKEMEKKLPNSLFLRIHRSYIVPLAKIVSYTKEFVIIHGKQIAVSKTYINRLLKSL